MKKKMTNMSFDIYGMEFEAKKNLVFTRAREYPNGNVSMGFLLFEVNECLDNNEKVAEFIAELLNERAKQR